LRTVLIGAANKRPEALATDVGITMKLIHTKAEATTFFAVVTE